MPLRPRPEIEKLSPAAHGGPNRAEESALGLVPEKILDFSVCSNPYIQPPDLSKVLTSADISRLPDSEATELRECLAGKLGVPAANIIAGNGSTELIRLIAQAYFSNGDSVLILEPTFGEYKVACQIAGANVLGHWAKDEDGFAYEIDETIALIKRSRPRGVFICNPDNPTGHYFKKREIEAVLDASPDSLLVMDEAYLAFVEKSWSSLGLIKRDNLIIVRSMTKDYAIAGLRLGYAVANRTIIEVLRRVSQPWNVNAAAQRAGIAVLQNDKALERSLRELRKASAFLRSELEQLGFQPLPSSTHFFLMKVDDVKKFRSALLKQGMVVRDCASFGLPSYVRIAARTLPECRKLIAAINKLKS